MANFNKTILLGRLVGDPETKQLQSGTTVAEFTLASSEKFTVKGEQREETLFIDCEVFGKSADIISQYLRKGSSVLVEGKLRLQKWESKEGGTRSKISLKVENFQFTDPPPSAGQGSQPKKVATKAAPTKAAKVEDEINDTPF